MQPTVALRTDGPSPWGPVASRFVWMTVLVGWSLSLASNAEACSTPVYRYAMYNWAPAPFFVFYFHHGEPAEEDAKVNQLIEELAETGPAVANLLMESVDLSNDELDRLPGPVKEAWEGLAGSEGDPPQTAHLVFTSWGAKLFAGRLDEATLRAMAESPARTRVANLLQEGCLGVIVFVPGSDEAENQRAEKAANELIAEAAAGTIPVEAAYLDASFAQMVPPGEEAAEDDGEEAPEDDGEEAGAARGLEVGLVKVARSDKAETWLVRSLMAMEPDLNELTEQPMIFFAYGRGRAMPPYVGKGISAENLAAELQFLGGACSCMVKEQNPGVDLLVRWDWESAADAVAATDPAFGADPFAYREFSPEESGEGVEATGMEAEKPASATETEAPGTETVAEVATTEGEPSSPAIEERALESDEKAGESERAEEEGSEESGEVAAKARREERISPTPIDQPVPPPGSFAARQIWTLGVGFFAAVILVVAIGFVLMRR